MSKKGARREKAIACRPCLEALGNWDLLCFPRDSSAYGLGSNDSDETNVREGNWSASCWSTRDRKWTFPESNLDWQVWSLGRSYQISQAHVHVPGEQPSFDAELHLVFQQEKNTNSSSSNTTNCTLTLAIPLTVSCSIRNHYEASLLTETNCLKKWDWNRIGSLFRTHFALWSLSQHHHIQARSPLFISKRDMEILRSTCARSPRSIAPENGYGLPLVIGIERMADSPPA